MSLALHASPRILDAMGADLGTRTSDALKDKVIHANIQIESIEDTSRQASSVREEAKLGNGNNLTLQNVAQQERATEMRMWFDEAIRRNMGLPDGYTKVAVLLIKWADELDELKTREEAEELEAVFRDRFNFQTKTVELNLSSKPQHQMNRYLSEFVEEHDGPNNLLIIYYTGHGVFREDRGHLDLTASLAPTTERGFNKVAQCNWNKAEDILRSEDVECDILTILDTCYASNLAKSGKEENRVMELLSACAIDQTTAAGQNSFTRALVDALRELLDDSGGRPISTFQLNQRILLDKRRHDTPSQLWYRLQHSDRHILLAPLKLQDNLEPQSPTLPQLPRGYLTLRFALRDESLNKEQIEYLTSNLAKAFNKKAMVGLRRVDWVGIKPARTTHFERAALATYVIKKWRNILKKKHEERQSKRKIDQVRFPANPLSWKRTRTTSEGLQEPEHDYIIPHPPSPPVSDSSRLGIGYADEDLHG